MRGRSAYRAQLVILFVCQISVCLGIDSSDPNQTSKYLDAVREFADNVLKYGRDTYGPKHTPLFVDGLNIHTHEPVKWIAPNGDRWILSNLASQQTFFRTLVGLTEITGDPKYKQAAMDAIRYAFEHLRSPNGLLYWGASVAYDAQADKAIKDNRHVLKGFYPYYELMWKVNPHATREFIESFWAYHIWDWSNLEMNRTARLDKLNVPKGWENEYKGGPVFFESEGRPFCTTGSDLYYAAAILSKLSDQEKPLIWGKRLAHRYVETRNPKTGISSYVYTLPRNRQGLLLANDSKKLRVYDLTMFYDIGWGDPRLRQDRLHAFTFSPGLVGNIGFTWWICQLLIGENLGTNGKEFQQWALEELSATSKVAYRKEDNSWIPMLRDGTSLEGYVLMEDTSFPPKGTVLKAWKADLTDFWAYGLAYHVTGDEFMWQMARNIACGNGIGDIGVTPEEEPLLNLKTNCVNAHALLGFLALYEKMKKGSFLEMAQRIGDNILAERFHRGFFVPSKSHIYAKFDAIESLVLLRLYTMVTSDLPSVPVVWPSVVFFNAAYRSKQEASDSALIYTLTESAEPLVSLSEAAAMGNLDLVKSLVANGVDVNSRERGDGSFTTPLHRAVLSGHTDVVKLLLANGAKTNAKGSWRQETPLHCAIRSNDTGQDIIELLIASRADVNAKDVQGRTPIDLAMNQGRKEIAKLLLSKSGDISLYTAAYLGDLQKVEKFIDDGTDVDAKDQEGQTALHYAAKAGDLAVAEFLIANGADVNAGGKWTPLQEASCYSKAMVELLLAKGADINAGEGYWSALHHAVDAWRFDIAELLLAKGADVNIRDDKGRTPLHIAAWYAAGKNNEIVELLLSNGADINTKDVSGKTALSYAIENGHTEIVELLHSRDADKSQQKVLSAFSLKYEDKNTRGAKQPVADMILVGEAIGYSDFGKDVNGDGYSDIIAGSPHCGSLTGRACLFYGGPNMDNKPDINFNAESVGNGFGVGVALGDINSDDYSDVVIGEVLRNSGRGRVYVYYGGTDMDAKPDKIFEGQDPNSWFGRWQSLDDINGDKCPDLIVTALNWDNKRGRIYIFHGSPSGSMDTSCDMILDGENCGDSFGRQTAAGKDVNGDGHPDLLVGAENWSGNINSRQGRAYLYYGGPNMDSKPDMIFTGELSSFKPGGRFGNAVELCDVDNDGFADVIIGAPHFYRLRGRTYLFFGGPEMDNVADKIFSLGDDIACGDMNNDGYKDIALGNSPYWRRTGVAYVYYGGSGRSIDQIPDMVFKGEEPDRRFGVTVDLADLNGDGFDDLAVEDFTIIDQDNRQGRIYLYYGRPDK